MKTKYLRHLSLLLPALVLLALGSAAQEWKRIQAPPAEVPSYTIKRVNQGIQIDGVVDEADWERTTSIYFTFPWSNGPQDGRQGTIARMLWDPGHLYISYVCDDPYLDAKVTERGGPVYNEDAVEIFVAPGEDVSTYFGYEMNINGALLDYIASGGGKKSTGNNRPVWQSEGVRIATSHKGTLNDHRDTDQSWSLEVAIPFDNFRHLDAQIPPQPGDVWRLNLNRTAGYQGRYSLWSDTGTPAPQFHMATRFGKVFFSSELVKKRCNCGKNRTP